MSIDRQSDLATDKPSKSHCSFCFKELSYALLTSIGSTACVECDEMLHKDRLTDDERIKYPTLAVVKALLPIDCKGPSMLFVDDEAVLTDEEKQTTRKFCMTPRKGTVYGRQLPFGDC